MYKRQLLKHAKHPAAEADLAVHHGLLDVDGAEALLARDAGDGCLLYTSHDVYLCAMLEYLMEYGEGQLCFTTHNVGPMDILKRHKKSIDFLSDDHKICLLYTSSGGSSAGW